MITILFHTKEIENLDEIISTLNNFKGITTNKISEIIGIFEMPIIYFEAFSHSLEYWGDFELI